MTSTGRLDELPQAFHALLSGTVRGPSVVDLSWLPLSDPLWARIGVASHQSC